MKNLKLFRENEITENTKIDDESRDYKFICARKDKKGSRVGRESYCICKYNVPEASATTPIQLYTLSGQTNTDIIGMEIDGGERTAILEKKVLGSGEHTIKYIFKHSKSSFRNFFYNCTTLTYFDGSHLDTSSATSLAYMFMNCSAMTYCDVSKFETDNVNRIHAVFNTCRSLKTIDVGNWNTSKFVSFNYIFGYCENLETVDVSNWDTSSVTSMSATFRECKNIDNVDVSNWKTDSVTTMSFMFDKCFKISNVDVSNWKTENVTTTYRMFDGCSKLKSVDLTNWRLPNVKILDEMFNFYIWNDASNVRYTVPSVLKSVGDLTNLGITNKLEGAYMMFCECSALTAVNVSNFVTDNVSGGTWEKRQGIAYMFCNCKNLTTIGDISSWNITNKIVHLRSTFNNCQKLTTIGDLSHWDVSNVTDMHATFYYCQNITSLGDLSNWRIPKCVNMYAAFRHCDKISDLGDISNLDTRKVVPGVDEPAKNERNFIFASMNLNNDTLHFTLSPIIGAQEYANNPKVTTLTIPSYVTKLNEKSFASCSISSVTWNDVTYTKESEFRTAWTAAGNYFYYSKDTSKGTVATPFNGNASSFVDVAIG